MKKNLLILFFSILFSNAGDSQVGLQVEGFSFIEKKTVSMVPQPDLNFLASSSPLPSFIHPHHPPDLRNSMTAPKAYHFEHLAFFCKVEVKLEKKVDIPLRLRLGTVDYVDRLEQKRANY